MNRWDYFWQYLTALIVFGVCSLWIRSPGYMDAEYYTLSAIQMVEGKGMTQPILWNYLDDPQGLPHPSHTYWMPAPSWVAAAGMSLSGRADFNSGRIPFIFLSALSAPMAGWMGFRMGRKRIIAWLAAGMAAFGGYYAVYASTIDSFYLVMLAAWTILTCLDRTLGNSGSHHNWLWLITGAAAGWMHMNRADGILWLLMVLLVCGFRVFRQAKKLRLRVLLTECCLVLIGYLAISGSWYFRNLSEFGTLFIPGSSRALWVNTYDELFIFPAAELTVEHWKNGGVANILSARLDAAGSILLTVLGVQGMVFLLPLWIIAFTKLRHDRLVQIGLGMEVALFLVMSFVFPFSGKRGGFLHSSAALQPFLWGLAAGGFSIVITWISPKKNWDPQRAVRMFAPGLVFICALATLFIFQILVIGPDVKNPVWDDSYRQSLVASELVETNRIPKNARTMINNPAGFSLASGRESLVIPFGDTTTLINAANTFDTEYILVEKNIVTGLMDLYLNPELYPQFSVIDRMEDKILLRVNSGEDVIQ